MNIYRIEDWTFPVIDSAAFIEAPDEATAKQYLHELAKTYKSEHLLAPEADWIITLEARPFSALIYRE